MRIAYICHFGMIKELHEHVDGPAVYIWPSASVFSPLNPQYSMNIGIMQDNKVSGESYWNKKSRSSSPVSSKLERDDYMVVESQIEDELESHKLPGLKRFRMTTLPISQNACSNATMGLISPLSPDLLHPFKSYGQHVNGTTAMPNLQSVSDSPFGQPQPPLGLVLRKSPSLVELVNRRLAQGDVMSPQSCGAIRGPPNKARKYNILLNNQQDKLKASNFSALALRIGTWEFTSKHEGDLVAKFYYAKRKLVWEILDSRLKSKLEIQWSDITVLNASCQEKKPDVLKIEVSRPPLFFREIDPQPKKHTLWQASSDFTGGQATICKQHCLVSSSGLLNRHYEKLMQCDPRLKSLSENPVLTGNSLHLEHQSVKVEGQHHFQHHVREEMHSIGQYTVPGSKCLPSFSSFQPLSRSTALLEDIVAMHHHSDIVSKFEPLVLDDQMTAWAPKVSFLPTGQSHQEGFSTDRQEVHCLKNRGNSDTNIARTAMPGILDHGLLASMLFQPSLETEHHSESRESQSSNWKKLDEVSRILLEEPYGHLPMSAGSAVLSSL